MMVLHRAARKRKSTKSSSHATANMAKPSKKANLSSSITDHGGGNCASTEPTTDG